MRQITKRNSIINSSPKNQTKVSLNISESLILTIEIDFYVTISNCAQDRRHNLVAGGRTQSQWTFPRHSLRQRCHRLRVNTRRFDKGCPRQQTVLTAVT